MSPNDRRVLIELWSMRGEYYLVVHQPLPPELLDSLGLVQVRLAAVAVDQVEHQEVELTHLDKLGLQSVLATQSLA